jgi:hypothetical protein
VRCLENDQFETCGSTPARRFFMYDSYEVLGKVCAPINPKSAMMFNRVMQRVRHSDLFSLAFALPLFFWVGITVLALSLVFVMFTICCTGVMTFCLFFMLSMSLLVIGVMVVLNLAFTGAFNDPFNALRLHYLQFLIAHKICITVCGALCILAGLFVLYYMCKYRRYIAAAQNLIRFASKSSLKNPMLVFLSFVVLCA